MRQDIFTIEENTRIADDTFRIVIAAKEAEYMRPGQFVQVRITDKYLRRPISVYDRDPGRITLVYKVVGGGTKILAETAPGEKLDVVTGLGNGFDLKKSGDSPLLVGGGVGVAPLYLLARELIAAGKNVSAVIGFRTASEVFGEKELAALGARVAVATEDGTRGVKGYVTDALPPETEYSFVYSCGPMPMMRALAGRVAAGEFSLEERMGCGFGACMGCSVQTTGGPRRVCREGPVFGKEEIVW